MNQRRVPRFATEQCIWITLFGDPDVRLPARIKNVSVHGVGLELQRPAAIGTAIKIEFEDTLLLGEVIYCRADEASFYVGVELEQALYGLADLAQTLGDFPDSPSGPQQTDPVTERRHQN